MTAKPTGVDVLRNATLFSLTRTGWSNYHKVDRKQITASNAEQSRLNHTKKLIESEQLNAVNKHLNDVYNWCLARAMPSTAIRRGIYFVKNDQVAIFEAKLAEANRVLHDEVVPAFLATYQAAKDRAKLPASNDPELKELGGLGDLYNESDYPTPDELRHAFGLKWAWLGLSVPDELPEEVRDREVAKLKQSFLEAQEEIKLALRSGFKQLVDHAVERLTPGADGKTKVFRDTVITNFNEFFETFNARNLLEDTELEAVVNQAKEIIAGIPDVDGLRSVESRRITNAIKLALKKNDKEKVRKLQQELSEQEKIDNQLRDSTAAQFAKVNAILDPLVLTPTRKFNFTDDQ